VRLDYHIPSPALRECLTVHAVCSDVVLATTEVLPAMLPNLHIRLAGASAYRMADGQVRAAPRVSLVGPTSQAYRIHLEPGLELLTAGLLPRGWHGLVRLPAVELGDQVLDGELLWGHAAVECLCDRLLATPDMAGRLQVLEAFLLAQLGQEARRASPALAAIDHWLEHERSLSLDALGAQLGVGSRQMRRLCLDLHGLSPKALAMKYRALRAAAGMAVRGPDAVSAALAGFADQAHLTRDFRRFIGWTPMAFARERQSITAATFAGRRAAGAVRPLSLLS
jgi:AraC-like DNA-binding protein